jgi:hypothetical protein
MKRAFLVGINKYGGGNNLNGCVPDVLLSYKILSEKFGFFKDNIEIITDEKATKKNIIEGLKCLTNNAVETDTLFFHYSGHGSQVVSKDWTKSSETDGRDEILCPVDLNWDDPLRDNDLNKIFSSVNSKIVIVLDNCFSGTGLRAGFFQPVKKGIYDIKSKFLTPPVTNILSNPTVSLDENLNYVFSKEIDSDIQTQLKRIAVSTNAQGNAILISGCKENQTSADAFIKSRYHGALTYSLYQTLEKFNFQITYAKLIIEINKTIKKAGFEQIPQLECKEEFQNTLFLG